MDRWTGGWTDMKPVYPAFNFVEVGGLMKIDVFKMAYFAQACGS